jgi:sigma-B regulation protein RsbU (phosphoserine phosphatase)
VVDAQGEIISHTFVPSIPQEIINIRDYPPAQGLREETEIRELGDFIDVSSPILAGVAGYVHVGMDKKLIRNNIWSTVIKQQGLIFIIFLITIILAYILVNRISQPLRRLAEHAKKLASSDFSKAEDIEADIKPLTIKSKDEVGELAESFIYMEEELRKSIKNLTETTAAKERIESELKIAREIQMGILPKIFPPFPHRPEFDIYATIEPAKEVGGDFYDFFFIDDDHLYFVIGDVSGKGVPASLFMAVTKTLIKAKTDRDTPPDEVLTRVNKELCSENESNMFVTIFYGVLNTRTGEVFYSNGGHNIPYLIYSHGGVEFLENTGGMALGIMEDVKYQTKRITLRTGDGLFLYTDGVTEAMDREGSLFSDRRLEEFLQRINGFSPAEIIRDVVGEVKNFSSGTPQSDDITILAIKYMQ